MFACFPNGVRVHVPKRGVCVCLCVLQTARWKVTSKEALQRIGEYSEAAITIRGTYFPPGKEPKEGERKIYLAIESKCARRLV